MLLGGLERKPDVMQPFEIVAAGTVHIYDLVLGVAGSGPWRAVGGRAEAAASGKERAAGGRKGAIGMIR